jgi:hypothetical protein
MRVLSFRGEADRMLAAEQRFAKRDAALQRKEIRAANAAPY